MSMMTAGISMLSICEQIFDPREKDLKMPDNKPQKIYLMEVHMQIEE